MSETVLSADVANALSGAIDNELDITYPAIGETPYHTSMYRLLERMASVLKAVNHLRVYKDGNLTIGVRPGAASRGASSYSYSGDSGVSLTNNARNYVYLAIEGSVLGINVTTDSMPTAATVPHIPLAIIDTGTESIAGVSGSFTADDIEDMRSAAMFRIVGS